MSDPTAPEQQPLQPAADTASLASGAAGAAPLPASRNYDNRAPIKAEFLKPPRQVATATAASASSAAAAAAAPAADDAAAEPAPKRAKTEFKKGTNKKRGRPTFGLRPCMRVLWGEPCPYAATCKFEHDLAAILAAQPAPLPGPCPQLAVFDSCRFGPLCRFAASHPPGMVLTQETTRRTVELNALSSDLQRDLRSFNVRFPRAAAYMEVLDASEAATASTTGGSATVTATVTGTTATGTPATVLTATATATTAPILLDLDALPEPRGGRGGVDFRGKLYLAPLTTVGNMPFRRVCKGLGADITCGEMAMASNLLQGQQSEWALLKRHPSEDLFGVQICGQGIEEIAKVSELIGSQLQVDFIDLNCGCPIDLVFNTGAGSALMGRPGKLEKLVRAMRYCAPTVPISVKMRMGIKDKDFVAHKLMAKLPIWGADLLTLHGRSRQQRYTGAANWDYISQCSTVVGDTAAFFGNGDVFTWEDAQGQRDVLAQKGLMIARGALIKPWVFTEIKEGRTWDISSAERMDLLRDFSKFGMEHWGSDSEGVEKTRRFMLEWMSFLHRYIPVGLLERLPQKLTQFAPAYVGRDDLETLMGSTDSRDWVALSEMLLGPVPDGFVFIPKHKANSVNAEG